MSVKTDKHTKVLDITGGINRLSGQAKPQESELFEAENIVFENGKLSARKGIFPIESTLIHDLDSTGSFQKGMTVTDTEYLDNGEIKKIAYNVWGDGETYEDLNIYTVNNALETDNIGTINIRPIDDVYHKFKNVFFIMGKPKYGTGLFVFLHCSTRIEGYLNEDFAIYEYIKPSGTFRKLEESDYYNPIIYINGRGNGYTEAKHSGWVFEGTPACPEEINLLSGRLTAYFTSDGYSSMFKLPVTELNPQKQSVCRIYDATNAYTEWILPVNTQSATATYKGQQITATLDCTSGYLYFMKGNEKYNIPKTDDINGNNIYISTHKNLPYYNQQIIGSENAMIFNARAYLYGNGQKPSEVYSCRLENPLYFPETMKTAIGNYNERVLALISNDKNIFAFKPEGIYSVLTSSDSGKTSLVSPIGVGRDFNKPDKLSTNVLSQNIGCASKESIGVCGNKVIFATTKNSVCAISSNGTISEISNKISYILDNFTQNDIKKSFFVDFNHKYVLVIKNSALMLDYNNSYFGMTENGKADKINWYYLTFPETQDYIGGATIQNDGYLICSNTEKTVNCFYKFFGDKDILLNPTDPTDFTNTRYIKFKLKSQQSDISKNARKSDIKNIDFLLFGFGLINIKIEGDKNFSKQGILLKGSRENSVKIFPFIMPTYNVSFDISGKAPFTLNKTIIEYYLK